MSPALDQWTLRLQPGDHLCLFYEKDAVEQMSALVPFIRDGLAKNEQFIYIADDQTVDELTGRLEDSGINVGTETDRGALKLWTRREWRQPGDLSSEIKSQQVSGFIDQAADSGFDGVRFAVEMTWVLGPNIDAAELEHWEATLNSLFSPAFPGRIICQYNRSRLSSEILLAALRTHPQIILENHVHSNLFYGAPLILKGDRDGESNCASASTKVEWMIQQLTQSNARLEKIIEERTRELEQAQAALMRDVEEQKKLGEQLRQAQKMECIGTLAGGIAHDFNNVLNIIKGYAAMVERRVSADEKTLQCLGVIDDAIERGASVVRQMLTLARKTEANLSATRTDELISELTPLLRQTFPKAIDVSVKLDRDLPSAMADHGQLTQALLNLCLNARDAMPGGGCLRLETSLVEGSELRRSHPEAEATSYICIEVADNGMGMDEAVRSRIFEPFFTTKKAGEGTGLGLSIVYGIVKNHKGFVKAESHLSQGTTFRLYLPVAVSEHRPEVVEKTTKKAKTPGRLKKGATILLAEDEVPMTILLEKVLSRHGYRVLVAQDGEEAMELYRRHRHDIDLVLLDIGLPKISGWDVIHMMKEKNPNINVVVASGYVDPDLKSRMYRAGVKGFIDKPYVPNKLVAALGSLIESA